MQIIENFLPEEIYNDFYNIMLKEKSFLWKYSDFVATDDDNSDFYFYHSFYAETEVDKPIQISPYFEKFIHPFMGRLQFNYFKRARANLYTKKTEQKQHDWHTDSDSPHVVGLWSLNTNNGYTVFKDGTKYYSKANTMLLFDGSLEHASVPQTDEKVRINFNFNFI